MTNHNTEYLEELTINYSEGLVHFEMLLPLLMHPHNIAQRHPSVLGWQPKVTQSYCSLFRWCDRAHLPTDWTEKKKCSTDDCRPKNSLASGLLVCLCTRGYSLVCRCVIRYFAEIRCLIVDLWHLFLLLSRLHARPEIKWSIHFPRQEAAFRGASAGLFSGRIPWLLFRSLQETTLHPSPRLCRPLEATWVQVLWIWRIIHSLWS